MATATGYTRTRTPNKSALVGQLANYGDDPTTDLPPVEPPAPYMPAPSGPTQTPSTPRVNPDGSVEVPEPGEPGYVAPGAAPPPPVYTPPNGNTGISGTAGGNTVPTLPPTSPTGTFPTGTGSPQYPASAYAPIPGFDIEKLNGTREYDSAEKYSDAVRLFSRGLGAGVPISRNNLGPMVDYAKANGFPNAYAVGDDKIDWDGPGGLPPDDLIRSDGLIVFQHGSDGQSPAAPTGTLPNPVGQTTSQPYVPWTPETLPTSAVPTPRRPMVGESGGAVAMPKPGLSGPWTGQGGPGPTTSPVAMTGGGASETPAPGTPSTGAGDLNNVFRDALVRMMDAPDPSLSDPELAAQSQANRVAQQRGAERRRAVAAERAAAGGQMGGAFDAGVDTIEAARSDAEGAFDAGLLADAQDDRRAQLQAALGPALGAMGLDQNESQFARSLFQNESQFGRTLSQQDRQFFANLNQSDRQFIQQLLLNDRQFAASLNQDDRQFLQNLGFQIAATNANLNQNALVSLIGGL